MSIGKSQLTTALRKLNRHYGLAIRFRTGFPHSGHNSPCADLDKAMVIFPPEPVFYKVHILAHEYAHILQGETDLEMALIRGEDNRHKLGFEAVYREVCLVLGLWPIPTCQLSEQLRNELRAKGIDPRPISREAPRVAEGEVM